MNLGIWEFDILQGDPAKPVATSSVTITEEETGNIASIFEDSAGATPLANPATFNDKTVKFYARNDRTYRLDIQAGSLTRTLRGQSVNARKEVALIMDEQTITSGGSIALDELTTDFTTPVKSDGGEVAASTTPFGDLTGSSAQTITLIGNDSDDFATFDSADVDYGLVLNGKIELREFRILKLEVDHVKKRIIEITRNL